MWRILFVLLLLEYVTDPQGEKGVIWIILPAYNEAACIGSLLDKIDAAGQGFPGGFRVLVVDDGSADGTGDAVRAHGLARRGLAAVTAHPRNMGLGAAMDTGIREFLERSAPGDIMVTMDADDTHEPSFIPSLLEALDQGADVAIASRFQPGGREVGVSLARRVFSRGVRVFMRFVAPVPGVRDYSCGYRAYKRSALEAGRRVFGDALAESRHFSIMAELLIKLAAAGAGFREVPFTLRYDRKQGPSKIRISATLRGYLDLVLMARRARAQARAARLR
jgi:dolichol-phosphate mannosyltransferase